MKRKHTVGIYLIRNNLTGRVYVGQSKHIEKRNRQELIKKMINRDFINDLEVYGISCFSCSTLEALPKYDKQLLNERERFYIALYNSDKKEHGYNKNRGIYKTYEARNKLDNKCKGKSLTSTDCYLKQQKRFIYLDGVKELIEKPVIIKPPKIVPVENKNRVKFIIEDSYIEEHKLSYIETESFSCFLIFRSWVIDQEKKEKRRLKYKERAERQKKGER
jgi:group I intron endonuclease